MRFPAAAPADERPVVDTSLLFGRCIAAMRRELGLSQAEVALRLGISRPSLTQIETGRSSPSFYLLARVGRGRREGRREWTAAELFALFHAGVTALRAQGVRLVNRAPREDEGPLEVARIDRVVGRVLDDLAESGELVLGAEPVRFEGDGDDD